MAVAMRRSPAGFSLRQIRRVGSRLGWGVTDQAASSLTNFLLNIFVARSLGAEQFGAFTLAYVTYGFALNASRGLAIEPLLVRFSGTSRRTWRHAASGSTGTALLVGVVSGICALAVGAIIGGTTGLAFLGLGLMLPGLMLQDSWRYAFFAAGKGQQALINDILWAVVEIPVLLALKATGHVNVFWFVIAWGAGAGAGAVFGVVQSWAVPGFKRAFSWLGTHRDLGPRFLAENCGGNAADTLRSYTVSSFLGLVPVGYMQSANVLMGPFRILTYGIGLMTIPEAAALLRRAPKKAVLYCVAVSVGQSVLGILWTVALLIGLPLGLGHLVLGVLWGNTYPLVLPTALTVIAGCANAGAGTGLHAMGAAKRSLRVALATGLLSLSLAFVGVLLNSMMITLYLVAVANWTGAMLSWLQFGRALRESGISGSPGRHRRPASGHFPRLRPAKRVQDTPATVAPVSRPVARDSYGREIGQGMPHAARPGEERS